MLGSNLQTRIQLVAGDADDAEVIYFWNGGASPGSVSPDGPFGEHLKLNPGRTLRTDGWNLDFSGIDAHEGQIDEYDVFAVVVHEVGHVLGLGHPGPVDKVMTPQDTSRMQAGGLWNDVLETTPFIGEPLDLDGLALPAGAWVYFDPRDALTFDDRMGATTLYTGPHALWIGSKLELPGPPPGPITHEYGYQVTNASAPDSAYRIREVRIPVSAALPVDDLTGPAGWTLRRLGDEVVATTSGAGLAPGDSLDFSLDSVAADASAQPVVRWRVEGLGPGDPTPHPDGGKEVDPAFDPADFGVLDEGRYTHVFDPVGDAWDVVLLDPVTVPLPEPGLPALASGVAMVAALRARRRLRTSAGCPG